MLKLLPCRDFRRVLISAEAELGGDATDAIELLVVSDVHQLEAVTDGVTDDCVAEVFGPGAALFLELAESAL